MLCNDCWNPGGDLRSACARTRTFLWRALCLTGMTIRKDLLGVSSSVVRALGLAPACYDRLLDLFHSPALHLMCITKHQNLCRARRFSVSAVSAAPRWLAHPSALSAPSTLSGFDLVFAQRLCGDYSPRWRLRRAMSPCLCGKMSCRVAATTNSPSRSCACRTHRVHGPRGSSSATPARAGRSGYK
jgi:hypothetical protein